MSEASKDMLYCSEYRGQDADGRSVLFRYCGFFEGLTYLAPFIGERLGAATRLGEPVPFPVQELEARCAAPGADLVVAAADLETIHVLAEQWSSPLIATRIHQVVKTMLGREHVNSLMSRRELKRGSQLRLNGFDYRTSNRDEDFFSFYHGMHRPTMEVRYGRYARSVEVETAYQTLFKRGLLFLVTLHGEPVAGSVSQIDETKNWLNARLIGVRDGDKRLRENGAQNFVYHAILDWACGEGHIDVVDFQGCEPFLSKGTFQYKKRFGSEAILPPNIFHDKRMTFLADLEHLAVRGFLCDNPVLLVTPTSAIEACYFHDATRPPRLDLPYICPGITTHRLYDLDEAARRGAMRMRGGL